MHAKAIRPLLPLLLFLPQIFGQTTQDRVFHLNPTDNDHDAQEIAMAIRLIDVFSEVTADTEKRTLAVRGTPGQMAFGDWLFPALDSPARTDSSAKEYRLSLSGDDIAAIVYLKNISDFPQFMDITSAVRALTGNRRLLIYYRTRSVLVRGTPAQIALTEWLLPQMDLPAAAAGSARRQDSAPYEYKGPAGNEAVQVFYFADTLTISDFQEAAVLIRSATGLRYGFTYNTPRALVVRGNAQQIALASWLANELNMPPNQTQGSTVHEYKVRENPDDAVRMFYLDPDQSEAAFRERMKGIRTDTKLQKVDIYTRLRAVAVRGTQNELAWADQLLKPR